MVETHREPVPEALGLTRKHAQRRVDPVRRRMQVRVEYHISASDRILGNGLTREVERAAVASPALFARPILSMDRTNTRQKPARAYDDMVASADRSGEHGSGNDGPRTGKREGTVDRKAKPARSLPPRKATGRIDQMRANRIYPVPVSTDTAITGAPASAVPASSRRTSASNSESRLRRHKIRFA